MFIFKQFLYFKPDYKSVMLSRRTYLLIMDLIVSACICISDLGGYDLIVMDPPWENKSVKRQKK